MNYRCRSAHHEPPTNSSKGQRGKRSILGNYTQRSVAVKRKETLLSFSHQLYCEECLMTHANVDDRNLTMGDG